MKNLIPFLIFSLLLFASACQKCYQCKQYCAYCFSNSNNGVTYKYCATKDVSHITIDSIYIAMQANGFSCSKLNKQQRVCDSKNKLNDAVDYYKFQDYYCYPAE